LTHAPGLTDRALRELATTRRICSLDLSACRQLSNTGITVLASTVGTGSPPLTSLRLDCCPLLGLEAAKALAALNDLQHCSLVRCSPLPEPAQAWNTNTERDRAQKALGIWKPSPNEVTEGCVETDVCILCLEELSSADPIWQCPVCACPMHNREGCARRWLREKSQCPKCRAVAFEPPPPPNVKVLLQRPKRASSVGTVQDSSNVERYRPKSPMRLSSMMGFPIVTRLHPPQHESRPPRPEAVHGHRPCAMPTQRAPARVSRSVPSKRTTGSPFALVGLSIAGTARG